MYVPAAASDERGHMKTTSLLERHSAAWLAATRHPFLDAVRDGGLPPRIFAAWLIQGSLFVTDELVFLAHLFAHAPRSAQAFLARSLVGLEAELSWFEDQAVQQNLVLQAQQHPVTAAYRAFLRELEQKAYPVAITALWAIERAYQEAWMNAAPGQPNYRQFVEHWTTPVFTEFVTELERMTLAALESNDADKEAEAAFLEVTRLECAFWEMAWSAQTE